MSRGAGIPGPALVLALALATPGCALRNAAGTDDTAGASAIGDSNTAGTAGDYSYYLNTLETIIGSDALTAAATMRRVADAADTAPTTSNRLMYALALGLPGHAGSDPVEAQRRLNALLASGNALLPAERLLATMRLQDVEQRLILANTAQDLRNELATATQAGDTRLQQRIETLLEENRRLRAELDDATEKLDAIASIEQSIRELEDGAN